MRDVTFGSDVRFAREKAEHITSLCDIGAIHHYGEAITSLRQSRNITFPLPLVISANLWYNEAKKGGGTGMEFSHCDHNEAYLTLHDCVAERAYFENGKLGFEFNDGFWISPDHPESSLSNVVRTDFAKVEYTLEDGEDYDVTVYVFEKSFFKKTFRTEWTVRQLVNKINSGKCRLEFLYQFLDAYSRIVECELKYDKKPYRMECIMKIAAPKVSYYWNRLREDRPW